MDELVKAVREHALKNYEKGGWDIIVECYSDEDIRKAIDNATSIDGAIRNVGEVARIQDERRKDVEGEIF